MQIKDDKNETRVVASEGQTEFIFDFPVYFDSHLVVYDGEVQASGTVWTKQTLNIDYTMVHTDEEKKTGKVVFSSGRTEGHKILILRQVPLTQLSEYVEGDRLPAKVFEADINLGVMRDQQHAREFGKCFRLAETSELENLTVPEPETGKVLYWVSDTEMGNRDVAELGIVVLPLPVEQGGTGAAEATAALDNLGAEPADANIVKAPDGILPILDGGALTNLSIPDVIPPGLQSRVMLNTLDVLALKDQDHYFNPGMMADAYETENGIDAAASAGENYDNVNKLYKNYSDSSIFTSGTATASSIYSGYTAGKAFDGLETSDNGWVANGVSYGTLKYELPNAMEVSSYSLYAFHQGADYGNALKTWTVEGSNDNTEWDVLDTRTGVVDWSSNNPKTFTITAPGSYKYYRLNITDVVLAGRQAGVGEWSGFSLSDISLVSESFAADGTPLKAKMITTVACAGEFNTDIKAYVSRDNGTTWTQGSLFKRADLVGDVDELEADFDLSAQPSGTHICYKIESYNKVQIDIYGTSLMWE